jgi:hypothetical protein
VRTGVPQRAPKGEPGGENRTRSERTRQRTNGCSLPGVLSVWVFPVPRRIAAGPLALESVAVSWRLRSMLVGSLAAIETGQQGHRG